MASIPFFPTDKRTYDIEDLRPNEQIMMELYPEIYSCIGCNACTKACPQKLNVMQYIAYAQRGDFEKCAKESFDCVSCGICSTRCPAGISHPMVGLLARRLTGKYIPAEGGTDVPRWKSDWKPPRVRCGNNRRPPSLLRPA